MASISKNVYINKLDDTVHKYNNTYHCTIEMKLVDVKSSTLILVTKIMKKILNLKLVILLEYQNTRITLQKGTLQTGLKNFL